jgi:hypothetical protein
MPDSAMSASYGETSYAPMGGFRPEARIGIGGDNQVGHQQLGYS